MSENRRTRTEKRVDTARRILTNAIWLVIVVVVLASLGRYFVTRDGVNVGVPTPVTKAIGKTIPWHEVAQSRAR